MQVPSSPDGARMDSSKGGSCASSSRFGTDSRWTRVYQGRHERIGIDMDGLYRFRSEPRPTEGYAYKLVLHWPMFLTHYNDDKTNPNFVRRTG